MCSTPTLDPEPLAARRAFPHLCVAFVPLFAAGAA